MAAKTSAQLTSANASIVEQVSGAGGTSNITGTLQEQLKPSPLISANFHIAGASQSLALSEVITNTDIYLKIPSLAQQVGKPWIKIPVTALKLGKSTLSQLLRSLSRTNNPLQQTALFKTGRNLRVVGTEVIGGVSTTHYSGAFSPAAALKQLPGSLRASLGTILKAVHGDVRFDIWLDAQHHTRKVRTVEQVSSSTVTSNITFSGINAPVHITPPAASQVATLPGSAF